MLNKINHTQLSNDFIDNYMKELSGSASKVFISITRKTVGWQKDTDYISISQIKDLTGLSKTQIIEAIKMLEDKNLIIVARKYGSTNKFTVNYDQSKKRTGKKNTGTETEPPGTETEQVTGTETEHTKEINKETITKEILSIWNNFKNLPTHNEKTFKRNIKKKHLDIIKEYSPEEIKKAIDNYNIILTEKKYYWSHRWTLWEFITRGLDRFVNIDLDKDFLDKNYKQSAYEQLMEERKNGS